MPPAWPRGAPTREERSARPPEPRMVVWWPISAMSVTSLWMTPLGSAVVPEVYAITTGWRGSPHDGVASGGASSSAVKFSVPCGKRPVADHDDRLEPGEVVTDLFERGEVVGAPETVGGHEEPDIAPPQDVGHLLGAVGVHDRHDHRPEIGDGVEHDGGFDPVGELEGDDVAARYAAARQPLGGP